MSKVENILLGVNVDHVATLRQARGTDYPDPLEGALMAQAGGADGITVHLREDRRHIQDDDVLRIKRTVDLPLNLEMAATEEMRRFALEILPVECCLVPERRQELTTEGGLDAAGRQEELREYCTALSAAGIRVSLFIDPDAHQVEAATAIGVPIIELHTGSYAEATERQNDELARIASAVKQGVSGGLQVNAGHGLHYENVPAVAAIADIVCLNIGHAIVARAVFDGMQKAVEEMKAAMTAARNASVG